MNKTRSQHLLSTLAFYASNPGFHSFDTRHRPTVRAVARLVNLGFLRRGSAYGQAEFTGKVFA